MKKLTLEKFKNAITFSLLLMAILGQSDFAMAAFSLSPKSENKVVTIFDGKQKKVVPTNANNFKEVLIENNVSLNAYDTFWASTKMVEDGSVLYVERAIPVTIIADGKSKVVYTTQQTVQGVVNSEGYDWKKVMPLENGLTMVKPGMQIHVVPYTVRTVKRTETMPIRYNKWYDGGLARGEMRVVQEGRAAKREVVAEEMVSDGKVIRTEILESHVIDNGAIGMAKTGNQEEAIGYVTTMQATAYHPSDGNGLGITATGTKAGRGTVAVDPRVIPLGTKMYIPNYGEAIAEDTGGAIKGNRIDLCMETFSECYSFGRQNVEVFVNY